MRITGGRIDVLAPLALVLAGCVAVPGSSGSVSVGELRRAELDMVTASDVPRELSKATIPAYRVEPPDVLLIETVQDLRPADTVLRPGDQLIVRASNVLPIDPQADQLENALKIINAAYLVEAGGAIDLGPEYGLVEVAGLTVEQATVAIEAHLVEVVGLKDPRVSVSLGNPNAPQPIAGEHLIGPDGSVNLGLYGSVHVAGRTVAEVRAVVEQHLSRSVQDPLVRVSVLGYNSKSIYVITDGGGRGEGVVRLPFTGNDTVLDAVAQIQGLSDVSSKNMWVARPAPAELCLAQTLPVDWRAITQDGVTATNYQLFPGDRIYIQADKFVTLDNFVAKVLSPVERVFGSIILGTGMVQRLEGQNVGGGGGFGGF
jgi:polysaccharide biosynthesis/export protein